LTDFLKEAEAHFPYTRALRRDLHAHPELGFREVRTSGIVARELETLGLEVRKGVGKTGVVALLEGAKPGPPCFCASIWTPFQSRRKRGRHTHRPLPA
jgi:metal-dependent amidase/aminoacylase/carboxypeptidase family protein